MDIVKVFTELEVVLKSITAPQGGQPLAGVVNDDPATPLTVFPVFVNIEEEEEIDSINLGLREEVLIVGMHLLFAAADSRYSIAARRAWRGPVLDVFDVKPGRDLNGEALRAHITNVGYRNADNPLALQGGVYISASFRLRVVWKGS
jgi:hypothetical protein